MKSYRQTMVPKALGIIRVRVFKVRRLENFPWGTKFPSESIGNFCSLENGIFQWISRIFFFFIYD